MLVTKNGFKILFIITILFTIISCKSEETETPKDGVIKYAQVIFRESPYGKLQGTIPMSDEEAANKRHYDFTYKDGKLVQVTLKMGNETYWNNNRNSMFLQSNNTKISYEENKIIHHYFNNKNEPVSVRGRVFKSIFELDENGDKKSLHFYDREGNPVENNAGISSYTWYKNGKGHVVEKRVNSSGELMPLRPNFFFYETHLEYDDKGFVRKMRNYGKEGKFVNNRTGVAMDVIEYDENGMFIGWSVYDNEMKPTIGNLPQVHKGKRYVDKYGDLIKAEFFDPEGNKMLNYQGIGSRELKRYENRLIAEQRFYDEKGNPLTRPRSSHIFRTIYDDRFDIIEGAAYDENQKRTPLVKGTEGSFYRMKHDDNHRAIEQTIFDKDENPINSPRFGGAHKVVITYGTDGIPKRTLFDKDGKKLN